MSSLYPPQVLLLPIHLGQRLPPSFQSVDLEVILVVHTLISLFASLFTFHISYALPLALFGLVAISSSLISTLLPHFLFFWVVSIPMDIAWLLYRVDQARLLVIALMGANMVFKVFSGGQAARLLQSQGALPDIESVGGFRGLGSNNRGWLGNQPEASPFGLPGSWNAADPANGNTTQGYTDNRSGAQPYSSVGHNNAIYEEADAIDGDAPQIHSDRLAKLASPKVTKGNYQVIE